MENRDLVKNTIAQSCVFDPIPTVNLYLALPSGEIREETGASAINSEDTVTTTYNTLNLSTVVVIELVV
ncbi:hypothetical protein Pcinc_006200 [Petrolisthes cinctipes]|uniref:Uncharacterized protein n=1 Tax=Petrolisthes cinctipes TaxID=88211 RepID=A0AAE1GDF3_PETCI|nr:hypothetical protein Pcinc_006200 [Petrolisthes cinctipes]